MSKKMNGKLSTETYRSKALASQSLRLTVGNCKGAGKNRAALNRPADIQ